MNAIEPPADLRIGDLCDLREAATILGYDQTYLYRLLRAGALRAYRLFGRVWVVERSEVERLRAAQTTPSGRLPRGTLTSE